MYISHDIPPTLYSHKVVEEYSQHTYEDIELNKEKYKAELKSCYVDRDAIASILKDAPE